MYTNVLHMDPTGLFHVQLTKEKDADPRWDVGYHMGRGQNISMSNWLINS